MTVYSSATEFRNKIINVQWDELFAMISYDDKRKVLHSQKNNITKRGDAILVRGYHKMTSHIQQFGTRLFNTVKGTKEPLQGHVASRPQEVYYEGTYWLPGTTKKRVMVTYSHLGADYQVYIPTMDILRGFQVPSACQRVKVKDTTAFHRMLINVLTQTSNNVQHVNQKKSDDESEEDIDISHSITSPPKEPQKPPPPPKKTNKLQNTESQNAEIDEFCMKESERFLNKDFNRKTKIQKKMQTAHKIVKINQTKAKNSKKKNHKTPISFATKVTFCLKYEDGMTNKQAWEWCRDMGFEVGKSWKNCHRWSQKGSAYWTACIAKSGHNNNKLLLLLFSLQKVQYICSIYMFNIF